MVNCEQLKKNKIKSKNSSISTSWPSSLHRTHVVNTKTIEETQCHL